MTDATPHLFASDGAILRGQLYAPPGAGPFPVVVMAHGFSAVKEHLLDDFAGYFCDGGLGVLVYDNRNLGASDGTPRGEIDPWQQVRDYRTAITWAQTRLHGSSQMSMTSGWTSRRRRPRSAA